MNRALGYHRVLASYKSSANEKDVHVGPCHQRHS